MRTHVWAIVAVAAIAAACSGPSAAPTSPTNAQSGAGGTGSSSPSNNNDPQIEGTVTALPPTTAALTFAVAGKTVVTTSSTVFVNDGATRTFADLKIGMKVEVSGTLSGNTLTASRVELEDAEEPRPGPAPNPPPQNPPAPNPAPGDEAEVEGTLGTIAGTCPAISSTAGTTKFTTTASTKFDDVTCGALKAGMKVEIKGSRNADGSITATKVEPQD